MKELVYVGPHHPGVNVIPADGSPEIEAEWGKPVAFNDETAKSLLAQGKDHWKAAAVAEPAVKKEVK